MGANQNNLKMPGGGTSKRGTTRNLDRLKALTGQSSAHDPTWRNANPQLVHAVVVAITDIGGAIMFGHSTDRGSYSMSFYLNKDKTTLWFNGDAELDEELQVVIDELNKVE